MRPIGTEQSLMTNDAMMASRHQIQEIWLDRLNLTYKFSAATSKVIVGEDYMYVLLNHAYVVVLIKIYKLLEPSWSFNHQIYTFPRPVNLKMIKIPGEYEPVFGVL
jgi:hypothetical protein